MIIDGPALRHFWDRTQRFDGGGRLVAVRPSLSRDERLPGITGVQVTKAGLGMLSKASNVLQLSLSKGLSKPIKVGVE